MAERDTKPRTRPLSIYLLKRSLRKMTEAVESPANLVDLPVSIGSITARLFVKPSQVRLPAWVGFLSGAVDLRAVKLQSASSAALLLLRVAGRLFAIAFGYGRHLLIPGCWDENFGLRVTLNSLEPNSIRSIDRKSFDAISRHTREEASREGSIEQFGLNIDQDLLRAVVGRPKDESLGTRLAGMDALTATVALELRHLPAQLERYARQSRKLVYRKRYPWVEQISEVRDPRQAEELDEMLETRLARRELEKTWLSVPVPLDWSQVGGFRYSLSDRAETFNDIHLRTLLASFRNPDAVTADRLRQRAVYCVDLDGRNPREKWSAYQCLYAEVRYQGSVFLLTGGRWYRVAPGFVTQVDRDVSQIPRTAIALPDYNHRSEGDYNRSIRTTNPREFALMDAKNIPYGGGASRIEFCDVYTRSRVMVHVKRYGASSVLSHLFAQGVVAATLFLHDAEFRKEVNKRLPATHRVRRPDRRPSPRGYEVAFAIVSHSQSDLQLPFFSKVNLRTAYQTLTGLGYQVSLTKVGVTLRQA